MADTIGSGKKYERMSRAQLIETLERLKREAEPGRLGGSLAAAKDVNGHELTVAEAPPPPTAPGLHKAETLLGQTERLAKIGYWEWDDAGGRCTYCSEGLAELLGTTPEDYIETSKSRDMELDWIHPDDRERWLRVDQAFKEKGEPYDIEYRHLKTNGVVIDIREVAEAVSYDRGRLTKSVGYIQDISDRKQIERALRDSDERYRRLVELSPDGVFVNQDGRFAFVNPAAVTALGADSAEQVLGTRVLDVIHPEFRPTAKVRAAKVLADERVAPMDQRYLRFDGGTLDIEATATPIQYEGRPAILSIFRDISERKRAERALKESEVREAAARAQLSEAIETLSEGFVWYDEEDRLVLFNSTYVEIYDKSRDLFVPGARFEDILRASVERGQYPDAAGGVDTWIAERLARHLNPSGPFHQRLHDNRWIQVSERRLPGGGIVGIRTDITWPKEMEQELRRKERLATLGQLTGTVSHELRNPLGALRVSVASIGKLTEGNDDPLLRSSIEIVQRSVTRCDNIISELLDFARITDLTLRPTEVDPWIMSVIEEFEFPPGLKVNPELGCGRAVDIDNNRMRRVMINLLENACQAMLDQQGEALTDAAHSLTVRTQTAGDELNISIADTGRGIATEELPKIFEPLFSTKTYGVGLGLSFVKHVIEQHTGSVAIDSAEGSGTTVLLSLPMRARGGTGATSAHR